jgi:short-subunit dehydrogenase
MPRPGQAPPTPAATVLVTGASSGIGQAIAGSCLRRGLTVYGTSRDPEAEGLDPGVRWLPFDGASKTGIESFLAGNGSLLKEVNVLVNNAGSSRFGDPVAMSHAERESEWRLLFTAPVELMSAAVPGMRARGEGLIVNITSLAAVFPLPGMSLYAAAKSALSQYTRSLQLTEDSRRLRLVDLQPGDIRTTFNRSVTAAGTLSLGEERAWRKMESLMAAAPHPERVARDFLRILDGTGHAVVRSGGFFQCRIAPLGIRLLPETLLRRAIRRYYRIEAE